MIVPRYYENLHMLHENTMPDRAYYIPASEQRNDLTEHRERSDRFHLLNGDWQFRYYRSIYDLKEPFYLEEGNLQEEASVPPDSHTLLPKPGMIPVPGAWQMYGYDRHQYLNIRYPFPADPPYVPHENPCGAYIHFFSYHKNKDAPKTFLEFEGVDSCFYVWLNGQYVGYSQVSHALSEFDVTEVIREGTNKLAVLVLKWCDGSYLEDQDKFRMNGIFRDVYLLDRPEDCLWDYTIQTRICEDQPELPVQAGIRAQIRIHPVFTGRPIPVQATLLDPSGHEITTFMFSEDTSVMVENPRLWNSEEPYLYTLIFTTEHEVITERVGIREIRIDGNVVKLNGQKIKFHGVNRHDFDPITGCVIDVPQMKKDLRMMKAHNFNAIRTSHYPNSPMFCQMCDEYGFFVINEADNESHGPWMLYYRKDTDEERAGRWNEMITDNPDFEEATMDRTRKLVERDKNRPCVVIWSMGNEGGYGCTFEKALAWTKVKDPTRLTHYESAYYKGFRRTYDYSNIDLYSRMYPAFEQVLDYVNSNPDKPFLMCEYCHSMGNGAGDYEDYFELIEKYDCICGGFVWEWCDEAIYEGVSENGRPIYHYGGDFGEELHDGNFCVDGLVRPDRTPHTGLLEYRNVHRPARVKAFDPEKGELTLKNELNFSDLSDCIRIQWEMTRAGIVVAEGSITDLPKTAPGETGRIYISVKPIPDSSEGRAFLNVAYYLKKPDLLREEGSFLGFDEIPLPVKTNPEEARRTRDHKKSGHGNILSVTENDRELTVTGNHFTYVFNKLKGVFRQLEVNGENFLTRPLEFNVWRAPTDNDMYIKAEWVKAGYDRAYSRNYETTWRMIRITEGDSRDDSENDSSFPAENMVEIESRTALCASGLQNIMTMKVLWKIADNGRISVHIEADRNPEFPELPRFGLRLFLPKAMNQVTYSGLGPMESYPDKCRAASHGVYHADVRDLHEDYLKPQENGSHCDCDFVTLQGARHALTAFSPTPFSFNASLYTQEELTRKAHNYELKESDSTVLCLDYKQDGIGSNSCGPRPLEKYRFDDPEFTFDLVLKPEPAG